MCVCVCVCVCVHTMQYYLVIKKEILPFVATWIDLADIMLSEINQTEKDTHISLKCRI